MCPMCSCVLSATHIFATQIVKERHGCDKQRSRRNAEMPDSARLALLTRAAVRGLYSASGLCPLGFTLQNLPGCWAACAQHVYISRLFTSGTAAEMFNARRRIVTCSVAAYCTPELSCCALKNACLRTPQCRALPSTQTNVHSCLQLATEHN
jgi:hypothetical protein